MSGNVSPIGTPSSTPNKSALRKKDRAVGNALVPYRYYRLLMTANDGDANYVSLSQVNLYDSGLVNRSYPQRLTATESHSISVTESAIYCFNSGLGDEWIGALAQLPLWVAVDLGAEYTITSYELSSQRGVVGRTPTAWSLQGSNVSQTGPWTDINSRASQTAWGIQETRSYSI